LIGRLQAEERLFSAPWLRLEETQAIFALLDGDKGRTRAVGGIVRDTILGRSRENADVDMATEILPGDVMARAQRLGVAAYPTGIEHGTVTLRIGDFIAEVTTLRQDIETDGRHAVVKFGTDWTRDAERRDFTLNALYVGMDGTLFDPLGGFEDCLSGHVRFIGDADRRIAEDRLRVYRFFRFSASHGGQKFDPDGIAAASRAAGTLSALSGERVGAEMLRLLALPAVALTLEHMVGASVLDFPNHLLVHLRTYEHIAVQPSAAGRLALIGAELGLEDIQKRWRLSNGQIARAEAIVRGATFVRQGQLNEAAYRSGAVLEEAADVAASLAGWTHKHADEIRIQLHGNRPPKFPLSGGDLVALGMRPGPSLGIELSRLEKMWIESGFALDRENLLALARR